jgi:hypothetical protein
VAGVCACADDNAVRLSPAASRKEKVCFMTMSR